MSRYFLVVLLAVAGIWSAWGTPDTAEIPLDVSRLTSQPERYHDATVCVRGIVSSVCKDEGSFIDVVPMSGSGDGVLVSARHGSFKFPEDSVGRIAVVKGTFYSKVYPFSRMHQWHHGNWRAWETAIPRFAKVYRIQADSVDFKDPEEKREIQETPLTPYTSPVVDLDYVEFEAAGMGTGKKCLDAGEDTPEHSSGRHHELLLAIEGELTVKLGSLAHEVKLSPGQACYVPPNTRHSVANTCGERACYVFVYSLPEQADADDDRSETTETHGQ